MQNAGVPLLQPTRKSSCRSLHVFFGFVTLLVVFYFQHNPVQEVPVGELAGCKTITGHYMEISTRKTKKNEIYVFQRGCQGRDVEHGAPFTVFGNTVSLGENKGIIQDDNSIAWSNGDKWSVVSEIVATLPPSATHLEQPSDTTEQACDQSPGGNCNCENVAGMYEEIDPNNPEKSGSKIMYRQMGCTGADLTNGAPFTIKKKHIKLMFGGDNEGDVQDDGSILWTNGFIHKPMSSHVLGTNNLFGGITAGTNQQPKQIANSGQAATQGVTNAVQGATQGVTNAATQGVTNAVEGAAQGVTNAATQGVTNAVEGATQGVTNAVEGATQGVTNAGNAATQGVTNTIKGATQGVTNAGNAATQGVTNAIQGAQNQVQGATQMAKMASMIG